MLNAGDRVWVKVPGYGFVGVGRVTGHAQPAADCWVITADGDRPVLDVAKGSSYHREFTNDPELCEYYVPIQWLQTVPLENSFQEIGLFGNQNIVCKPTTPKWRSTVARLKERFLDFDKT
jgi:hypothetical protein